MSKSSREYWRERQVQSTLRSEKNTKRVHREMKEAYQEAADSINDEIAKFFARLSKSGKIPAAELFRMLTPNEVTKWKMSLEGYMAQIAVLEDSHPEQAKALMMELEFLSARTRINRLEALQSQITMQMTTLARVEDDKVREHLVKEYQQSYYTAMYDFYKDSNPKVLALMEASKVRIDPIMLYDTLSLPWSGSNYSERIWKRQYDVSRKLKQMMAHHLLTGVSIQRMTKDVTAELGKDYKYAAERLLRTETAWVHGQADKAIYERLEVEEYEFIATLDVKTSSICRSLDLKRFKVSEAVVGKNYPPMHPNCRSTTGIYDPTWNDGTRIARGADGKSYSVPIKMNYEEWYNSLEPQEQELMELIRVMDKNKSADLKQFEKYKLIYPKEFKNLKDFQALKYNNPEKWVSLKKERQRVLNSMDYKDSWFGKFSNREVRYWYKSKIESIPSQLNTTLPLKEQAIQSTDLRNKYKKQARDMMEDQKKRQELDSQEKPKSFEYLLQRKLKKYGLTEEEAYKDIIRSSTTSNERYDKLAGVEEE
ncbi:MAG: minor capsid protein [Peptostreptococcaceae bacterium]|nr:minor capsid protein [Peptostreptococcaceae bacterium]